MDAPTLRELCFGSLMVETALCAAALSIAWLSRRRFRERLGLARGTLSAKRCALLVLGAVALSFALDGIIEQADLRDGTPLAEFAELLAGAGGADLALALLALGLAPGFAEELLCRGLVQRGLEARLGAAGAVVVAALFFGALHVDAVHGGFAVLLGLYLGVAAALVSRGAGTVTVETVVEIGPAYENPQLRAPFEPPEGDGGGPADGPDGLVEGVPGT